MSWTPNKKALVRDMEARITELQALEVRNAAFDSGMSIEIFSLKEELAYLLRSKGLNHPEHSRIRTKFNLPRKVTRPEGWTSDRIERTIAAAAVPPKTVEAVLKLPAHPRIDRVRLRYDRYCVNCDSLLAQQGPRYICLNCRGDRKSESAHSAN